MLGMFADLRASCLNIVQTQHTRAHARTYRFRMDVNVFHRLQVFILVPWAHFSPSLSENPVLRMTVQKFSFLFRELVSVCTKRRLFC